MDQNNEKCLKDIGLRLRAEAENCRQRRLIVLSGPRDWACRGAELILGSASGEGALWVTDRDSSSFRTLTPQRAHAVLGQEAGSVVLDAYCGFDPDVFGSIIGTVRAGGLFLLCVPPLNEWPAFADPVNERIAVEPVPPSELGGRYIRRIVRIIRSFPELALIQQRGRDTDATVSTGNRERADSISESTVASDCRTPDQQLAVEAIMRTATGHRHRPSVLVSDRGRGKSAALGIAAARLLGEGLKNTIIVTAPRSETATTALKHCAELLSGADVERNRVRKGNAEFKFVAPDALCRVPQSADLVLVDEAAAIPATLLQQLLRRHSRIVFATTIHGYEGTGRGFAVRFRHTLDKVTPNWREIRLKTPIRWADHDPVEQFAFRALLMDAAPIADLEAIDVEENRIEFRRLDRDRLAADEPLLAQLFGLLVLAHYRTSPLDLRQLLDGPNISVFALQVEGRIVAAALTADEGGFSPSICRQVYLGNRRFRGHLLPQSLSQQLGVEDAPRLKGRRIIRIAVHPDAQRRGLGRMLVARIERASEPDRAYLGASFGADAPLLDFWTACGFLPVKLGLARDTTSGSHSVIVAQALNSDGATILAHARTRYLRQLPSILADSARDLEADLASRLMRRGTTEMSPLDLCPDDWSDILSFGFSNRQYEAVPAAIKQLVLYALADPKCPLTADERACRLLIQRVMQNLGWKQAAENTGLSGRKAAVQTARLAIRRLAEHYGDAKTLKKLPGFRQ